MDIKNNSQCQTTKVRYKKLVSGFTLIEMMIVVAILAILSIVGIPSYQNYIIESAMKEASQVALKDAQFMEKFYALNGKYTTGSAWPTLPYQVSPESGTTTLYRITLTPSSYTSSNDNSYRLQAQPICGTVVANNGCVCIDQDNNVYLSQTKLCLNSSTACSCTN